MQLTVSSEPHSLFLQKVVETAGFIEMTEKFLKYTRCQPKRNDVHPVIWICDCHRNWIHCFVIIDNNKLRFKSEPRELNQNDGKLF